MFRGAEHDYLNLLVFGKGAQIAQEGRARLARGDAVFADFRFHEDRCRQYKSLSGRMKLIFEVMLRVNNRGCAEGMTARARVSADQFAFNEKGDAFRVKFAFIDSPRELLVDFKGEDFKVRGFKCSRFYYSVLRSQI
jgi:hypothetical protein